MANKILREYVISEPIIGLSALKAFDTTNLQDGVMANVQNFGVVRFDQRSSLTANDISIIEPNTGGGRWYKVTTSFSGNVFTVSGDGTSDFTTVEAAINALDDGDGVIRVVGNTIETGTATIIEPVTPRSLRIEVEPHATVNCGDNTLLDITTSTGVLNLTLSGKFNYAFTSGKDLFDWTGANLGGFLFIENAIFINESTVASTWVLNNLDILVFWESSAIFLPNQDKGGLSLGKINGNGMFLYSGGTSCSDALVVQDVRGLIRGLKLYGSFSLSFPAVTTACALANVNFENTNSYFVNFFESVTNVTTDSSVTTVLGSDGSYSNFKGDISVAFSNSTNSNFSNSKIFALLPSINANSKCSFSNVTVTTSMDLTGGKDIFTNLRCDAGIAISNDNITLNSPSVLDGGQTITVNATAENTIIKDARVDTEIVDNGVNSDIAGTYINTSTFNYFRPTSNKNYIINGGFSVWQRGTVIDNTTVYDNSDNAYVVDRWRLLHDGGNVVSLERDDTFVPDGSTYSCKMTLNLGSTKFGLMQILTSKNSLALISGGNGRPSLQFKLATQSAVTPTFKAAVLGWSGTADAVSSDPISSWNASNVEPTLAANWNYRSDIISFPVPDNYSDGSFKIENIEMNSADKNLAVFIWRDGIGADISGAIFNLTDVKLEENRYCSDYEQGLDSETIIACQYYFQKTYNLDTAPATVTATGEILCMFGNTFGDSAGNFSFKNGMRKVPSPTFYSPNDGASGNIYNYTATSNAACTAFNRIGQNSSSGLNGTWTASDIAGFHYTLDAEL